jgi:hypothetical protein
MQADALLRVKSNRKIRVVSDKNATA